LQISQTFFNQPSTKTTDHPSALEETHVCQNFSDVGVVIEFLLLAIGDSSQQRHSES
jgi:hypothetical protein